MSFAGFSPETFAFYDALVADNTKRFWDEHKATYRDKVKAPLIDLCATFPEYGTFHVFRPNRDVRFSKEKIPYKTHAGAYAETEGGGGYYVQVSAAGMFAGAGYYSLASDQLERCRRAVDDETTGPNLVMVVDSLRRIGLTVSSFSTLKTAPRGWPKDHPRIELLRMRGIHAGRDWKPTAWMRSAKARGRVAEVFAGVAPLCDWMDRHVGPSQLPPEESRWG